MNFKSRTIPGLIVLSLACAGLAACEKQSGEVSSPSGAAIIQANIITVKNSEMPVFIISPGNIVAEQQAQIASRLMGFIREINVQEGQVVTAGQVLFSIDATDIQGQMNMARAGLSQAEAALADSEADYQRFDSLYKEEVIPKLQWDKVRLQHQVAQQQVESAHAAFDTASAQMNYASVRAPFAGVITQKMANAGDLAAPGRPLLVLENPAKVQVQTTVTEDAFHQLKLGSEVSIQIDGVNNELVGKVARLVPSADPVTHSYLVKIDLPHGHGLKSGTFVRASFRIGTRKGIHLPATALLERAGIAGVFVVDEKGIAHYRMVRTGAVSGDSVEIQAGLTEGDRVVSSSSGSLQSGDQVVSQGSAS
jgi:RND family efflux transporter MFP subunit